MTIENLRKWLGSSAPYLGDTELQRDARRALIEYDVMKTDRDALNGEYNALSDKLDALTDERNKLLARVVELENFLKHKEGIIESIWAGDSGTECAECGRLTANGICTECRHGTSPLKLAQKRATDAEAARDADREVYLEVRKAMEQQVAAVLTAEAQAVKRADELEAALGKSYDTLRLIIDEGEVCEETDSVVRRASAIAHAVLFESDQPEPCAHSHTLDLKCIDCGAAVPASDPLAKAVASAEPEVERCDHSLNEVTPSGVTCLICGETMETP